MRCFVMVLDGFGIGKCEDSHLYGDLNPNTYCHILDKIKINIPNLKRMGLNNIDGLNLEKEDNPIASYGKLRELSSGKDTTTGHLEIMGVVTKEPYPTFTDTGFPDSFIKEFEKKIGTKVLCNKAYSGTVVIQDYGKEHIKTGYPIVYTSKDSVFQIACHTDVIPLERLYEICKIARKMLVGNLGVARVIARPFTTIKNKFVRTEDRKDYALDVPKNLLDKMIESNLDTIGIGKIEDIFNHRGLKESYHTKNNTQGLEETIRQTKRDFNGLCFINLVDTDMLYGHRNDYIGYAKALEEIDSKIPAILNNLANDDVFIITADHGCDPTDISTDHTREFVPLLVYKKGKEGKNLGTIDGFNYISKEIEKIFKI